MNKKLLRQWIMNLTRSISATHCTTSASAVKIFRADHSSNARALSIQGDPSHIMPSSHLLPVTPIVPSSKILQTCRIVSLATFLYPCSHSNFSVLRGTLSPLPCVGINDYTKCVLLPPCKFDMPLGRPKTRKNYDIPPIQINS